VVEENGYPLGIHSFVSISLRGGIVSWPLAYLYVIAGLLARPGALSVGGSTSPISTLSLRTRWPHGRSRLHGKCFDGLMRFRH
jgi:hypothetical protein